MKSGGFNLDNNEFIHTIYRTGRNTPMDNVKVQAVGNDKPDRLGNRNCIDNYIEDGGIINASRPYAVSYTYR